jgi:glucose/arabinose dehydrogenase
MVYKNNELISEEIIVDKIPGASNHDGGRIKFGPDKMLYIGTGDAQEPSRSQDTNSLAGKILRVSEEGKVEVYSYGHRNVQGLTWDTNGTMYSTEHGRSGVQSGFDELNLVKQGKNYGWPDSEGDKTLPGTVGPIKHSGATNTWAPSGMAYLSGSIFFGGLRGQALYEAVLNGNKVSQVKEHFKGLYGRIRDVVVGPDNMVYFTTSNRDGRGNPTNEDDRIIRVNPAQLAN